MLLESEIPSIWRRVWALAIDLAVVHIGLSVVLPSLEMSLWGRWCLAFGVAVCYSAIMLEMRGQTLGKMALRIRVISAGDGGLRYGQTFLRAALKWFPIFTVFALLAVVMPEELRSPATQQEWIARADGDSGPSILSSVIILAGALIWWILTVQSKRHPDGQAPHDRVCDTYVTRAL